MTSEVLPVRDLLRSPGSTKHVQGVLVLGEPGLTSARLDVSVPATYTFTLQSRPGQLSVVGTIRSGWVGECRRCLGIARGVIDVSVDERFDERPVEGESWPIDDGHIDIAPMAIEVLLVELPLAPLCREDCVGPDPEHFPMENDLEHDQIVSQPSVDPRWAGLEGINLDADS